MSKCKCKEKIRKAKSGEVVGVCGDCWEEGLATLNKSLNKKVQPTQSLGTTVEVKRKYFSIFTSLISNQFNHGGNKYKLKGFDDREATDIISSVFGGETELDWIMGTIMKYVFRFNNFHREKDLLKIATYCYIAWLKMGAHLKEQHDEDTNEKQE